MADVLVIAYVNVVSCASGSVTVALAALTVLAATVTGMYSNKAAQAARGSDHG